MPAIVQKKKSQKSKGKATGSRSDKSEQEESAKFSLFADWKASTALLGSGAVLGLSAPGFDQWYLAWFGLSPLLIGSATSKAWWQAGIRGTLFGIGYNATYWSWLTGLQPLDWLGFAGWQGWCMAAAAVGYVAVHQGLFVGVFAAIIRLIPTTGMFWPNKTKTGWKLPLLTIAPLLWVVLINKVLNAHDILGVPWSMLEYSQYKQLPFIQAASIIGGIGIGFLLMVSNTTISAFICSFWSKKNFELIAAPGKMIASLQLLSVALAVCLITFLGMNKLSATREVATVPVEVLQGNINIEMQKTKHRYSLEELVTHYSKMIEKTAPGLLVWTESALPAYLRQSTATQALLENMSKSRHSDMIIGAIDADDMQRPYNAAFGITGSGALLPNAYHKRYLVPFGEYAPVILQCLPECVKTLTNTPAGGGFESGKTADILDLSCGHVAPLICFECLSPELVADSVRHGADFLVNISDLAWFHKGMCGDQMIAFAIFRAIENDRYLVFAANTGPSAIIAPNGEVKARCGQTGEQILSGNVCLKRDKTLFTSWFR